MRKGVPISPGVAVARAYCVDHSDAPAQAHPITTEDISGEVGRFMAACAAAAEEIDTLVARVSREVGEDEAAMLRGQRMLIRDPALINKVRSIIVNRKVDAATALREAMDEYGNLFARIEDDYLRERVADIRDVVNRISGKLEKQDHHPVFEIDEPVILVAREILPSRAVTLDKLHVAGMLTETGGSTGHAAIVARSLGIPAISGLRGVLREVHTGDMVAMDAREGQIYINPGPEVQAAYRKLQHEFVDLRDRLIENREQESVSADGIRVDLLANVSGPADAETAVRAGASGVGLYRTEYLFLTHPSVPDEEEQFEAYRKTVEAAPNKYVTIRTLDLGGDKQVPYFGARSEGNPFMGWRSIRLMTAFPEFFQTQLRAILRAAKFGWVSVLFPMISTLEEVRRIKRLLERTKVTLRQRGASFAEDVPVGVMIEVPAAAVCIDSILKELDYISIGSNDLAQYLMAADRDNPRVAQLCEPFHPAIMRVLNDIIQKCTERGKPVTLCGEMAASPRCFLPLFGMGLRHLSMSPAFVPPLKELVRSTTLKKASQIADRVLKMETVGEVRGYLTRKLHDMCPNIAFLDMRR
jgi:phosphoenolpyruvate-protein phosphotransferase (PTS system enzyme I)